jgi:hypothetical protein
MAMMSRTLEIREKDPSKPSLNFVCGSTALMIEGYTPSSDLSKLVKPKVSDKTNVKTPSSIEDPSRSSSKTSSKNPSLPISTDFNSPEEQLPLDNNEDEDEEIDQTAKLLQQQRLVSELNKSLPHYIVIWDTFAKMCTKATRTFLLGEDSTTISTMDHHVEELVLDYETLSLEDSSHYEDQEVARLESTIPSISEAAMKRSALITMTQRQFCISLIILLFILQERYFIFFLENSILILILILIFFNL